MEHAMTADAESFEWRATGGRRWPGPLAWLFVVSASAAAGVLFAQMHSIEMLVSAFERNAVPAKQVLQGSEQGSSQRVQLVEVPALTQRVILLNPQVVREAPNYAALSSPPKSVRRTKIAKQPVGKGPRLAMRLFGRNSVY